MNYKHMAVDCQLIWKLSEAGAGPSSTRYYVKYLGSVEVKHHKGTDVLCQAIHKVGCHK